MSGTTIEKGEWNVENFSITHLRFKGEIKRLESLLLNSDAVLPSSKNKALDIALRCVFLYFNRNGGMSSQSVFDFYFPKNEISIEASDIDGIVSYVDEIICDCPKAVTRVNLPIVFVIADKAIRQGMSKDIFTEKIKQFFDVKSYNHSEYRQNTISGAMKKERVQKRIELLEKSIL